MVDVKSLWNRLIDALKDNEPTEEIQEMNRRNRFLPLEPYFYRLFRLIIGFMIITELIGIVTPDLLTKPLFILPENGTINYLWLVAPFILFTMLFFVSESIGGYALNKAAWCYDVIIGRIKPSEAVKTIVLVLVFIIVVFYLRIFPLHTIR
jgi:hypothetical protein